MTEDGAVADFVSGIKNIGPAYPVRPVVPAQKDRKTGQRRNERQEPEEDDAEKDDGNPKPTIDEHV